MSPHGAQAAAWHGGVRHCASPASRGQEVQRQQPRARCDAAQPCHNWLRVSRKVSDDGFLLLPVSGGCGTCVALRPPLCGGRCPPRAPARLAQPSLCSACPSRWASISLGVGPSRDPQGAHGEEVTPWSYGRAPHWGQGCRAAWSTGMRWDDSTERHLWPWRTRLSSGDGRGVGAPPRHAARPGALAVQHWWRVPAA
jgi:hypothetical protein